MGASRDARTKGIFMGRRVTLLVASALTVGMLASPASAEDPIECGDTITESVTLTADLGPCPGGGLIVGADGVTIDLGGHTLTGMGPENLADYWGNFYGFGVMNEGYDNVTITNGSIGHFSMGVELRDGVTGTTVSHLDISWVSNGMGTSGSGNSYNSISHNTIQNFSTFGMHLGYASEPGSSMGNTVNWNTITCNEWPEGAAIFVQNTAGTKLVHNTTNDCWAGVGLDDTSRTNLVHNTISGACIGVELNYASGTKLVHTEISVVGSTRPYCGPLPAVVVLNGESPKIVPRP